MSDTPPPIDNPTEAKRLRDIRLLGIIIMTMSGLVAFLCGMCTLSFLSGTGGAGNVGDFYGLIALVIGGFPTAVGIAGFIAGLALYRSGGPQWAKDDPRWIARRQRLGVAVTVFAIAATAAIIALWNFGGQILFAAAGFGIARWMFLHVDPADRETALRHHIIGGGLLAGVAVIGLWLRDAAMLFEGVGFAIALWLYRFGGMEWLKSR